MAKGKKTTAIPYQLFPDNPRVITEDEFLRLGESMGESGSLDGIVVNLSPGKYQGAIISGNQKVKHMGIETLFPTIVERFTEPTAAGTIAIGHVIFKGEKFPYREVYWSETKCEINNIRANNYGGHNDPKLLSLFPGEVLSAANIDMDYERQYYNLLSTMVVQPELSEEEMQRFFENSENGQNAEGKQKLILEYTDDEFKTVKDGLLKIAKTPEQAVWQLLGLG